MQLSGLVRIRRLDIVEEDVLGLRLPALRAVEFDTADYALLATPFWVDDLVTCLKEVATYRIRLQVYRERVARLQGAVRRITQRVNLFEKVLIPNAEQNIARIQIFPDIARAAVVNSKIAKAKHVAEPVAGRGCQRRCINVHCGVIKVTLYGPRPRKRRSSMAPKPRLFI
jgi:V/A-type H+-transporting ATPase subunit D